MRRRISIFFRKIKIRITILRKTMRKGHHSYWVNQEIVNQQPLLNLLLYAGTKKELVAAMRSPTCAELALWSRPVQNHLCWAAASSQGNPDLIVRKWLSVLNHVRDIHNHTDARFSFCAHGELEPRDWLLDDSVAFEKLQAIVTKRYLLADLPKLSTRYQTYTVEAFHGLLNHFCPKLCQYSYKGMTARTQLAVLHFNENGNRPQALTEEGDKCYDMKHPKANGGEPVAVKRKEGRTYDVFWSTLISLGTRP
ncbi:uncharacterized protein ISCGN_004678 [Ixodes scapularis]